MRTREPALGHLARVVQKVPTIRHLNSARYGKSRCARILGRPIASYHLDLRARTQPARKGRGGALGQEIDDAAGVQIDEDRAVGVTTS
jgi:hypothetical protein